MEGTIRENVRIFKAEVSGGEREGYGRIAGF
jgi:hypothetical protein